jgi:hypothetical protein
MLRKIFTFMLAVALTASMANATVRRVGFTASNPVIGVDYTTLQLAHDASATGDTIQIYPTTPNTDWNCTMTKRLTMLGTGYMTTGVGNFNANYQAILGFCNVYITLSAGSGGSVFAGLGTVQMSSNGNLSGQRLGITVTQNAVVNNITIKRSCLINVLLANQAINDGWIVSQCFFYTGQSNPIYLSGGGATNLRIENCIDNGAHFTLTSSCTGQIVNCNFTAINLDFANSQMLVQNSIFYGCNLNNSTNSVFQNNVTSQAQAGNPMETVGSSGNKYGIVFNTNSNPNTTTNNSIFTGYPYNNDAANNTIYSEDTRFQLKGSNAATGAGLGGTDCGAFGGVNPYKVSGIINTPSFYKLTAPSSSTSSSPYTITFSVRSNN